MTTNSYPIQEPAHPSITRALRVQRLWIDGHDRWVSPPRRDTEQVRSLSPAAQIFRDMLLRWREGLEA